MRRFLCYVVMIGLVFFIQTGIFTQLPLGGIVPNLFIICTASIGMLRGKAEGCLVGFFFGILMDTLFSGYFGFYALIFSVIGYLTGYIKQIFYEEDMTLPIVMIGAADILYGIIVYLCTFLTRGRMDFLYYFRKIILPEMVYTLIIAVFLYRLFSWINRKIEIKGSENRID